MLVSPKKHPHVKEKLGNKFINWLTGNAGQTAIKAYKLKGKQLFFPNAAH
jgi:tungstate transport system substrate-binding protein